MKARKREQEITRPESENYIDCHHDKEFKYPEKFYTHEGILYCQARGCQLKNEKTGICVLKTRTGLEQGLTN